MRFHSYALIPDPNPDRHVNALDFNILATNFSKTGTSFGDGDFNYDGTVDGLDFSPLAGKFGTYLAAQSGAPSFRPLAMAPARAELFGSSLIDPTSKPNS